MNFARRRCWTILAIALFAPPSLQAADPTPQQQQFQDFVRNYATKMRADDRPPATKEEWLQRKAEIREKLEAVWNFPDEDCPLEPKILGEEQRDGYRFQRLVFQTMPGVWMTAFAYIPDGEGPFPAILHVHGHWKGAKQDPVLQARSIGSVKHGFVVLAVDAFGAGERGLTKKLGEYHGEMVGATLFPVGRPLSGLQVYENGRALEYLQSRPDVIPDKIGITGASGGGNQSMYAGCYDERFACVVPCCSVGSYDSYLTAASCMCEVMPNTLTFTEEWGVLGLAAPRGLMVINASKDSFVFSIGESQKTLAKTDDVFFVMGQPGHVKHATFFWHHDYSKSMREAMYGWMTYHLKGEGDGAPLPDPKIETFDPEQIRCFPGDSRPDDWLTLPQFAAREGKELLDNWQMPASKEEWEKQSAEMRKTLVETTFGGFPEKTPLNVKKLPGKEKDVTHLRFEPEPGITLTARWEHPPEHKKVTLIILNLDGTGVAWKSSAIDDARNAQCQIVTLDLRATGVHAWPGDNIMRAPDHNTAQWSMWIGRPLLGQWTYDVLRLIDALRELDSKQLGEEIIIIGQGPAGVVALCAAAVDDSERIQSVAVEGILASYVSDVPYENQRVGIMAPGIVRDVGDIPHLAALALRSQVSILRAVAGDGEPVDGEQAFVVTRQLADLIGSKNLELTQD